MFKYLLIFSVFICSCNNKPVYEKIFDSKRVLLDSVNTKQRPLGKIEVEYALNLSDLEKQKGQTELRIYEGHAFTDTIQLIRLRKSSGNEWSFTKYIIKTSDFKRIVFTQENFIAEPKGGWEKFNYKMDSSQVWSLPDCEDIKDYNFTTDGSGTTIEFIKGNEYRIYSYQNTRWNKDIAEAVYLSKFLKELSDKFQFNWFLESI